MKRYCLINSISGILSVELMMIYCPDNIGKDTIRRVSEHTLTRATLAHRRIRGIVFGMTCILLILSTITY